jgi:uncharacterized protein
MTAQAAAPTAPDRHVTLDALRGFAVMGILAMNIVAFAMPDMAYMSPAIYGGDTGADLFSWFASFILIDGKMRGLFSLLFGASMMLIVDRATAKGENAARVHYSRMAWLAIFGLAHFYLIWFGDILFVYAVIGCIAFLFRNWEAKRLIKWAIGLYAAGTLLWSAMMGGMIFLQKSAQAPGAPPEVVKEYQAMMNGPEFSPQRTQKQLDTYRGSYTRIVGDKWAEQKWQPFSFIPQILLETLPLMMLGMALLKNGFLLGTWDSVRYRRWAVVLVPAGAVVSALLAWIIARSNFDLVTVINATFAWAMLPRLPMIVGYAALLVLAIRALARSGFLARVAAAGQAAFTNYLGASILMTSIFYGYGLGQFGHVGRAQLWLFVAAAWVLMLLWSKPWLERFRYGPLEWLWRSLARGSVQPMRR